MKSKSIWALGAGAFCVGLLAPVAAADTRVSAWKAFYPGAYCAVGHAVINNGTEKGGSTVRSVENGYPHALCNANNLQHNLPVRWLGVEATLTSYSPSVNVSWLCGHHGPVYNPTATYAYSTNVAIQVNDPSRCPKSRGWQYNARGEQYRWNGSTYVHGEQNSPKLAFN